MNGTLKIWTNCRLGFKNIYFQSKFQTGLLVTSIPYTFSHDCVPQDCIPSFQPQKIADKISNFFQAYAVDAKTAQDGHVIMILSKRGSFGILTIEIKFGIFIIIQVQFCHIDQVCKTINHELGPQDLQVTLKDLTW